jgi:hypothetical protein
LESDELCTNSATDLTKTVIHGSLQLIDSGVTKATDLAKVSLEFVKRSVNTGADFAIGALDSAKTKTSGTLKVWHQIIFKYLIDSAFKNSIFFTFFGICRLTAVTATKIVSISMFMIISQ